MSSDAQFKTDLIELLPRLYRYARVLTPSRSDADDLVQMTCERALTRWSQFRPEHPMVAWLFTIMNSIWKNDLRARAIRAGQGFVDTDTLVNQDAKTAVDGLYYSQIIKNVNSLPETQRDVVFLVYVEGYKYAEAAEILETPIGTVMSRLARARISLSRTMTEGRARNEQVPHRHPEKHNPQQRNEPVVT